MPHSALLNSERPHAASPYREGLELREKEREQFLAFRITAKPLAARLLRAFRDGELFAAPHAQRIELSRLSGVKVLIRHLLCGVGNKSFKVSDRRLFDFC